MKAPKDIQELKEAIIASHDGLSPRLRQVAAYALDHPNDMGLETLAVIADRCGVQASTIVRFAKAFGYEGASQMQRLFRDELLNTSPSPSYAERVRQFNRQSGKSSPRSPEQLLHEFAGSNIMALEHLKDAIDARDLEKSVDMIVNANNVYLVGLRRSFPVAAYLAYALRHVDKQAHLIDGLAGMLVEQSSMITGDDVLFAISYRPYAEETAQIVHRAKEAGAGVITISDSQLSPVARDADISFEVKDAEVRNFRSLTGSMCLAQTLVIAYAHRLEGNQ